MPCWSAHMRAHDAGGIHTSPPLKRPRARFEKCSAGSLPAWKLAMKTPRELSDRELLRHCRRIAPDHEPTRTDPTPSLALEEHRTIFKPSPRARSPRHVSLLFPQHRAANLLRLHRVISLPMGLWGNLCRRYRVKRNPCVPLPKHSYSRCKLPACSRRLCGPLLAWDRPSQKFVDKTAP